MKITQQASSDTVTIALDGELDASSSSLLDESLGNPNLAKYSKVLIDCSNLKYISSAGLGVFISHIKRLQDANIKLVFFNMKDKIFNVFEVLGLDALLTIVPTEVEAAAA